MKMLRLLKNWKEGLVNIIYPKKCFGCKKAEDYLCPECEKKIPTINFKLLNDRKLTAIFPYANPAVRKMIWRMKYDGVKDICPFLGKMVYDRLVEELYELMIFNQGIKIFLIPVPLTPAKKRGRGYNQCEEICKEVARLDSDCFILAKDVLTRKKDSVPQMKIKDPKERRKNVKGAFSVQNREKIRDQVVILLDDVYTTGSTMKEAMKALEKAKPARIFPLAIAHGK